jgi:hypothetical protein
MDSGGCRLTEKSAVVRSPEPRSNPSISTLYLDKVHTWCIHCIGVS